MLYKRVADSKFIFFFSILEVFGKIYMEKKKTYLLHILRADKLRT